MACGGRSGRERSKVSFDLDIYVSYPSDHGKTPRTGDDTFVPSADVLF